MSKTFILDIDDTIICRGTRQNYDKIVTFNSFDDEDEVVEKHILIRPWLDEFIEFCKKENYKIAVWSAGQPNYVNEIVKNIFDVPPVFVYNWTHCYREGSRYYKRLSWCPTGLENTFIIDDNPDVIYEKDNCIPIKPFTGERNDVELLKIIRKFRN